MKKIIASMLLFSIVCLQTSCADSGEPSVESTETTTTAETEVSLLPDVKYNGETVTLLVRSEFIYEFSAEQTGDVVDDAVFARNAEIEELYNINIDVADIPGSFSQRQDFIDTFSADILAGDSHYDIIVSAANYMLQQIPNGYFTNLYELPYINLSEDWWTQGYVDNLTIDDALYLATGSASINLIENMGVMFFNKGMIDDFGLENPYELVTSGGWTLDKLREMASAVTSDLNGDSKIDTSDRVGFYTYNNTVSAQVLSFGINYTSRGDDGYPQISFINERTLNAFDKMVDFYKSGSMLIQGYKGVSDSLQLVEKMQQSFQENNILFMAQVLSSAVKMRTMDADFGIIPLPKLDSEQSEYYTCSIENMSVIGVPVTVRDPELAGAVVEAMAVLGYEDVVPAYFETALQTKYSRDNDSAEMLELIRDSLTFDFGYLNSVSLSDINHIFNDQIEKGEALTSAYETISGTVETNLEALLDGYRALES